MSLDYKFSKEEKRIFSKMRIIILSPMMAPEPRWIRSLANMIAYSWMAGLRIYCMASVEKVVVDWARNNLAEAGYQKKCEYTGKHYTHFLWLDADHVFNPDLGCHLARHFLDKRVDGVSALYYARSGPPLPVAFVKAEGKDDYLHYPIIVIPNTLCEVDAFGFGACLMKRSIFGIVPKPWFTIDFRAGEDIAFCRKAKMLGVRWFVDGAYKLGHIGEAPVVTEKTYQDHLAKNPDAYAEKVKIFLGGQENVECMDTNGIRAKNESVLPQGTV